MDERIEIRKERARGCGRRTKPGSLYMVDLDLDDWRPCGKLPAAVSVCPYCGSGIRPARQFVWVDGDSVLAEAKAKICAGAKGCGSCPMSEGFDIGRAGLLWVGASHYRNAAAFIKEACGQGISRRVNFVPHGFEIGKTWILLGHKAEGGEPGIITVFKPKAIEVLCTGDETAAQVDAYVKRGLTPVLALKEDGSLASEPEEEDEL